MLAVRKEGEQSYQSHHHFHVRRAIVEHALTWLIENNTYYRANQVHIIKVALAQMPQDNDLSTLSSVHPNPPSLGNKEHSH